MNSRDFTSPWASWTRETPPGAFYGAWRGGRARVACRSCVQCGAGGPQAVSRSDHYDCRMNDFIRQDSRVRAIIDVELARLRWRKRDLAEKLGVRDTTFSGYLNGAHPLPPGLLSKIEQKLKLAPGTLDGAQ